MNFVFDFSGVVFNNARKLTVGLISKRFGLKPELLDALLYGDFTKEYRTGLISGEEFWERFQKKTSVGDVGEVKQIFFESYHPDFEMLDFIKQLKDEGHKLGYLSNSPQDRTEYLNRRYEHMQLFDFGLCSFEAHAWKPQPKIYKLLLSKFKLNPKATIYIDDLEEYLIPAKQFGIITILFENLKKLKKEIKQYL